MLMRKIQRYIGNLNLGSLLQLRPTSNAYRQLVGPTKRYEQSAMVDKGLRSQFIGNQE